MARADIVVLGAGVVGLACARALALRGHEVFVVEAEAGIGRRTSSRNSGVIHAGLYYPQASWKARLVVHGAKQLYAFCERAGVPHERTGKWVLASDENELPALAALADNARRNGVDDLSRVSTRELGQREPSLRAVQALWSPSSGVVDAHALMEALLGELRAADGTLVLGQRVVGLTRSGAGWTLSLTPSEARTSVGAGPESGASSSGRGPGSGVERVEARAVVNACGHDAPEVARWAGVELARLGLRPSLYRGDYMSLDPRAPRPTCALVYPLPQRHGLGVHLTRDLGGRLRAGPDAYAVERADVSLARLDNAAWEQKAARFADAIGRYLPGVLPEHLTPEFAGVRPKIERPGDAPADFALLAPEDVGTPGIVHLLGIESPGLTACLAIAEWVATRLESRTTVA